LALLVEADRSLSVFTDGKEQALGISPPRDLAGGVLSIEVENTPPPAIAEIRRINGQKVRCGDNLSTDELANLVYVSLHKAIPNTPPTFVYLVTSSSGEHGRQTMRFRLVQSDATAIPPSPDCI
jgi:hypothetical protein